MLSKGIAQLIEALQLYEVPHKWVLIDLKKFRRSVVEVEETISSLEFVDVKLEKEDVKMANFYGYTIVSMVLFFTVTVPYSDGDYIEGNIPESSAIEAVNYVLISDLLEGLYNDIDSEGNGIMDYMPILNIDREEAEGLDVQYYLSSFKLTFIIDTEDADRDGDFEISSDRFNAVAIAGSLEDTIEFIRKIMCSSIGEYKLMEQSYQILRGILPIP